MAGEEVISYMQMMTLIAMIFMIVGAIGWVLAIALSKFTPGLTFLKAKLKGQNIAMVIRRDRKADMSLGKYSAGVIETKKYGDYIIDPDSVLNESKSGVRLFTCSTELGATISPTVAKIIQGLQDMKIPNLRIAKMLNSQLHICNDCKHETLADMKTQEDPKTKKMLTFWECHECHGKNLQKADMEIQRLGVEALKFENLSKWSDTVMNPILQASNKSLKVEEAMMDISKPKLGMLMTLVGIGMLFFFVCLGLVILWPQISGSHAAPIVQQIVNATGG